MATYSPISEADGQPIINVAGRLGGVFWAPRPLSKTIFDKCFALAALVFFAPFFVVIMAAIFVFERENVFYRHVRVGEGGRLFRCLKFRTMKRDADVLLRKHLEDYPEARAGWEENQKLKHDPRITCLGYFLRKSSLDELPQFWNVLMGDMAVVGPRPIVSDETRHYGPDLKYYLAVRPGITGLWQVSGRSDVSYDERVKLDVTYVRKQSLLFDLKIILKTVKVVLFQEGAC